VPTIADIVVPTQSPPLTVSSREVPTQRPAAFTTLGVGALGVGALGESFPPHPHNTRMTKRLGRRFMARSPELRETAATSDE
jgi:hypothetical protein